MNVSAKRIEANRRNAARSTGPTTAEGKARASRNATTHGLTATLPMSGGEVEAALAARLASCRATYGPRDDYENWLVDELAGVTLKLSRIGAMERRIAAVAATRASAELWENDRRLEVATIAGRLERQPDLTVARLRQTPQGCEWLIEHWEGLAEAAETTGWTDAQTTLAHHLLGTPDPFRTGPIGRERGHEPNKEGQPGGIEPAHGERAREEIERLLATHELVAVLDETTRSAVEMGLSDLPNHDAVLLRRYELASRRYLIWVMNQMRAVGMVANTRPGFATMPAIVTAPAPPQPAPMPVVTPAAPKSDLPEVVSSHHERNEPIIRPLDAITPSPEVKVPAHHRPDLARMAKRDRKARRKRGQQRRSG